MKQVNVAIVTLHADPSTPSGVGDGGGTHSYVRELMVGLAAEGWKVTVLTRWADPKLPERDHLSANVSVIRLRIGEVAPLDKRLLDGLHSLSLAAARGALAGGSHIHLLHSVYWNSGRVAMDLAAELNLPFTHTVISNGWRRWNEGARDQPPTRIGVEKQVFNAAFAVFCVSDQERDDVIEHYGLNSGKVVVVGRPVSSRFHHVCHDEMGRPSMANWSQFVR